MTTQNKRLQGRIFYDVDTQADFMNKEGALYVSGAEEIKPNLKKLARYAQARAIKIIGSVDKHFGTPEYKEREGELARWGGPFPDHCMDCTRGQLKINETRLRLLDEEDAYFLSRPVPDASTDELRRVAQTALGYKLSALYLEKQSYDVFTNPLAEVLLREAGVKEAIVYGVATDFCVRAAVLGMQQRGIQCYVVQDAIRGVFPDKSALALEEMARAGAKLVTTQDVLENKL